MEAEKAIGEIFESFDKKKLKPSGALVEPSYSTNAATEDGMVQTNTDRSTEFDTPDNTTGIDLSYNEKASPTVENPQSSIVIDPLTFDNYVE